MVTFAKQPQQKQMPPSMRTVAHSFRVDRDWERSGLQAMVAGEAALASAGTRIDHDFSRLGLRAKGQAGSRIQRKLAISTPDDPLEREADWLAEAVLSSTGPVTDSFSAPASSVQRSATKGVGAADHAPDSVAEVLATPGNPLPDSVRAQFEPRFGHDFSQVRVHTDSLAARSAAEVNALAYTVGRDIVFGARAYAPETYKGRLYLAHELAHVVQQEGAPKGSKRPQPTQPKFEAEAHAASWSAASGQRPALNGRSHQVLLQKLDLTIDSLSSDDIEPMAAVASADYVDNNILEAGLREEWSGLSVRFIATTIKYKDGSLLDIPIDPKYLGNPKKANEIQIIRYRLHSGTGKIVPVTWRGTADQLPNTPGGPLGTVIFAKDITPAIIAAYDDALLRRAFAFAGDMAAIWGAALGARGLAQMFSATQAARVAAAGRGALGGGAAAARQAAIREAERQAVEAEKRTLIQQLRASGAKFAEAEIVQIVRSAGGRVVWLERGNASAGLQHIMARHGAQFAKLGIEGEGNVSKLIIDTLRTKTPIRVDKGGQVFRTLIGTTEREMNIVVGDNGFVVTAYPL